MEIVFLTYRFVGTRHQTVTRAIQKCFVGSILASDELVNKITSRRPSESAAPPIPAIGLQLSTKKFQVSVKYRLGIAVYDQEKKCPYCKSSTLNRLGDHAVACHGRGDVISGHDRIRDRIASACSAADLSSVIEKSDLIAQNNSRPGDVYLPFWKSGQPAALDITATSSLQPNIIFHAAEKSGYASEAAEDRKYSQYEKSSAQQGIVFIPLAIKVFGGLSRTLKKALLRISLLPASRNYQSVGQSIAFDRAVLSLSVASYKNQLICCCREPRS